MDQHGNPRYFISFAKDDNRPPDIAPYGGLKYEAKGWVHGFKEALADKLGTKIGRKRFSDFYYPENETQGTVPDLIASNIRMSDALVAIISGNSNVSSWCDQERQLFRKMCSKRGFNPTERFFIVRLSNTPLPADFPPHTLYDDFWHPNGRKFADPTPATTNDEHFHNGIVRLADRMAKLFKKSHPHLAEKPGRASSPVGKHPQRVYVDGPPEDVDFVIKVARHLAGKFKPPVTYLPAHDQSAPHASSEPDSQFIDFVDESDVVVVVRKTGSPIYMMKRHTDARNRYLELGSDKNYKNVIGIDAGHDSLSVSQCAQRVIDHVEERRR